MIFTVNNPCFLLSDSLVQELLYDYSCCSQVGLKSSQTSCFKKLLVGQSLSSGIINNEAAADLESV